MQWHTIFGVNPEVAFFEVMVLLGSGEQKCKSNVAS